MAIWVKGYTKDDGTKVKGHYRSLEIGMAVDRKRMKKASNLIRMGQSSAKVQSQIYTEALRSKRPASDAVKKRIYGEGESGQNLAKIFLDFKG